MDKIRGWLWLGLGTSLLLLGRQLNLEYCQYRQLSGIFTDIIPFPPGYLSSVGDFLQLGGYCLALYWSVWFLFKRRVHQTLL
jgi:hypothetical protein